MKILHIISGLRTGGAETVLLRLCKDAKDLGVEHSVVSLTTLGTKGAELRKKGVDVYALGLDYRSALVPTGLWRLRQIVRKCKPDVIQGWMYHGNLIACIARTLSGPSRVPVVWNIRHALHDIGHEKRMTRAVVYANRRFSSSPQAIVYNSVVSRTQHEEFGFHAKRGCVIPNGFDLSVYAPNAVVRERIRKQLGIPMDSCVIGHIGRFHPLKNHRGFLCMISAVLEKYQGVHVVLAGKGVEMQNPVIGESLRSLGHPGDRIHFLGERDDVANLMASMDILVSSSYSEAFPNVLGEAMASGVVCVATDVGDSALIVGDAGRIVGSTDFSSMQRCVEDLIEMPEESLRAIGASARRSIEDRFSLDLMRERYRAMYCDLVQ